MSAFLCDPHHLTALATFAWDNGLARGSTTHEVFDLLLQENLRSLEARYREPFWDATGYTPCFRCEREEFVLVEIVKAAACYAYQACEHDEWPASRACEIATGIETEAARCLGKTSLAVRASREYDAAEWGYLPRHG